MQFAWIMLLIIQPDTDAVISPVQRVKKIQETKNHRHILLQEKPGRFRFYCYGAALLMYSYHKVNID